MVIELFLEIRERDIIDQRVQAIDTFHSVVLELVATEFLVRVDHFPFILIWHDFEHVFVVEEPVISGLRA